MTTPPDPWAPLRRWSPARIALGRAGGSLPTRALLEFQLAHSQARDAVLLPLDLPALQHDFATLGIETVTAQSAAPTRAAYIERPDLGRRLDGHSCAALTALAANPPADIAFVVSDGLSPLAVQQNAAPLLARLLPRLRALGRTLAPVVVAVNARVALADEVAAALNATCAVSLIGERPGLSAADSLGAYLTWQPAPGLTNDAARNCLSNIRAGGLSPAEAAHRLLYLLEEARARGLSGVALKEAAEPLSEAQLEAAYPPLTALPPG